MIVVTGGAGFIGSCIVARLNADGCCDIIVVDHKESRGINTENLAGKKYAQYLTQEDFLNRILKAGLPWPVEGIIHMGACSSTTLDDARYYETNNFEYTRHLAQWALRHDVRFIYASSAATYGDGSLGYSDEDETTRRLKPLNLYGQSKQKFDAWAIDNRVADKMAGLKFFNVFGPNEYHKGDMRSVAAKAYDRIVREGKIKLFKSYKSEYADGEQKRDFIYIKDAVDVVMHFWAHPDVNGIYNVGTGKARTWNDLARALFAAVGKEPCIEYIDMPESIRPRYQYFTQAEVTKLRDSGYKKPFTGLEDALRDYAGYLKTKGYI